MWPLLRISLNGMAVFLNTAFEMCPEAIQDRTQARMIRAEEAVVTLIASAQMARHAGRPAVELQVVQELQREAQWRLDFVAAKYSMGFHAPREVAHILDKVRDYACQGEVAVLKANGFARAAD